MSKCDSHSPPTSADLMSVPSLETKLREFVITEHRQFYLACYENALTIVALEILHQFVVLRSRSKLLDVGNFYDHKTVWRDHFYVH